MANCCPSALWVTRGQRCLCGSRRAQVGQARGEGQPASRKEAASWSAGLCRRLVVGHGAFTRRNKRHSLAESGGAAKALHPAAEGRAETCIPHARTARPGRGLLAPERHGHVSCERVGKQTFATRGAPGRLGREHGEEDHGRTTGTIWTATPRGDRDCRRRCRCERGG